MFSIVLHHFILIILYGVQITPNLLFYECTEDIELIATSFFSSIQTEI